MNNNRGNNNRRRGRGNNNRQQGGQQINRIDSRARGNAPQMLEKYRKLAHDAHLNGDRVTEEYYLQFADHYFRVIADTRQRQEEQRLRRDERWQDGAEGDRDEADDTDGYAADSPYAVYDQQNFQQRPREDRQREDRQRDDRPREERQREDRPREDRQREDRPREDRQRDDRPREDRPRQQRPREDRAETVAEPVAAEATEGAEGNPYEPAENPFTRGSRGLKPRREDRRPRRRDDDEAAAPQDDAAPAGLDPSALPPAIAPRAEPEAVDEPAEEKPRRRTRRAKPPADDAGETLEAVS